MSSASFTKKLTREITRSPKKTAVLALLGVVALWFWAPLVWKWMSPEGSNGAVIAKPASPAIVPAKPAAPAGPASLDLDALLTQLAKQQQIRNSAVLPPGASDPFAMGGLQVEDAAAKNVKDVPKEPVPPPKAIRPQDVGLVLGGTLIGPKLKVATINGQAVRVGAIVDVQGFTTPISFEVKEIQPDRVVLTRDDEAFDLLLTNTQNETSPPGKESMVMANSQNRTERIVVAPQSMEVSQ